MSDVEFGGMGVDQVLVGSWGSFWKKIGHVVKSVFTGKAFKSAAKMALNAYAPGAGDALDKGITMIESAKKGDKTSLAQIKAIADAAKAGDVSKQGAHDMLTTINDARNEAKAEIAAVAVGAKTTVIQKNGKPKTFGSLAAAKAWMAKSPGSRLAGQGGGSAQRKPAAQRPVNQQQIQQAIQRTPQQNRPALMQGILAQQQQNMQQGYPFGQQQPYGMQTPYGVQPQQYGSPYGVQQPYGYSSGPGYGDQGYPEDYGDDSFAEDTTFPDEESIQG
jgi:hypothetical protein